MNTQYNDSGKKETDMNRQIRCMSFNCLMSKWQFLSIASLNACYQVLGNITKIWEKRKMKWQRRKTKTTSTSTLLSDKDPTQQKDNWSHYIQCQHKCLRTLIRAYILLLAIKRIAKHHYMIRHLNWNNVTDKIESKFLVKNHSKWENTGKNIELSNCSNSLIGSAREESTGRPSRPLTPIPTHCKWSAIQVMSHFISRNVSSIFQLH